jgi:2-polyprenyl-6-methoxyphenol hydroxylase-like FAD-dependent oxidoreductase
MTPGRGVGANTALRDAALLCNRLIAVRDERAGLIEAIHEYEAEMLRYSTEAVLESRKQMDSREAIHKPVLGRVILSCMRAYMRLANRIPQLKLAMTKKEMRLRAAEQSNLKPNIGPMPDGS